MTKTADIITRNFLRMMRSGAMGEYVELEPMSEYKWHKVAEMAITQNVASVTDKAARNYQFDKAFSMSSQCRMMLHAEAEKSHGNEIKATLSNRFLNARLKKIIRAELASEECSKETLALLQILVAIANSILRGNRMTRLIIRLGNMMRTYGHKVDYVKINTWVRQLHIRKLSQLTGSILIASFSFHPEEVPFVNKVDKKAEETMMHSLTDTPRKSFCMRASYFTYAPIESVSMLMSGIKNRLEDIDE